MTTLRLGALFLSELSLNLANLTSVVYAKTTEFEYDDLYRLTQASSTDAVSGGDYIRTYSYTAIGNINTKSDQGGYSYTGNQGTSYANPHAVTDINGTSYSYDNNGNLTSDSAWTHSWDYNNRLTHSTNGSTKGTTTSWNLTFSYDHEGNRVQVVASSSDSGISATTYPNKYFSISGATTTKHIFAGNELIATIVADGISTSTYYIHTDHLGGTGVVSNSVGEVEQILDYYPFGDIRINEKENIFDEERKHTGHIHDSETNLNYMISRYQNPATGRFLSVDPVIRELGDLRRVDRPEYNEKNYKEQQLKILANPQRLNSYSYVLNNPLVYYDPWGLAEVYIRQSGKENSNSKDIGAKMGHVMIKVDDKYYGFSPTGNQHDDVQIMNADEFNYYYDNQNWEVIDIGDDYDEGIVQFYTNLKSQGPDAQGGDYNFFLNNCTTKAQEALEYAGFDIKTPYWYTPNGLYQYFNTVQKFEGIYQKYFDNNYSPTIKSIDSIHSEMRIYNYGV